MNAWKVLLIEDDSYSADVVSRILTYHKIEHTIVASAEGALELLKQDTPNLLIVDLALPGMNGWDFLKTVRRDPANAHIPAVAVTAFHSTLVAQQAIEMGFNAYFAKPIEATSFVRELERVLNE